MSDIDYSFLIQKALEARQKAYVPYSRFQVGAALLCEDGTVYGGCNIENSSYPASNCAERTALFSAIYEGHRDFRAIAVVGGLQGAAQLKLCPPCGVCRQTLSEFCDPEHFEFILAKTPADYQVYKLKEILPFSFTPENLDE